MMETLDEHHPHLWSVTDAGPITENDANELNKNRASFFFMAGAILTVLFIYSEFILGDN